MKTRAAVVLATLLALAAAPAQAGAADRAEEAVFTRIAERLALMMPVAAWKMERGAPVEDKAREAVVLDKAAEAAEAEGLSGESARPFFAAQIEAAKDIQRCWIARWEAGEASPPAETPDLKTEIRPELIRLGAEILASIRAALDAGAGFGAESAPAFRDAVALDCLSDPSRNAILEALAGVRPAA
ncbi:MAG: gamma subclass chorismate mutase AroQ [Pseudomonadota bacterium]